MNPLIAPELDALAAEADEVTGPLVASLYDLVDQYEAGDFSRSWGEAITSGLIGKMSKTALIALIRIYHYLNELIRIEYDRIIRERRDSPKQGDSS